MTRERANVQHNAPLPEQICAENVQAVMSCPIRKWSSLSLVCFDTFSPIFFCNSIDLLYNVHDSFYYY